MVKSAADSAHGMEGRLFGVGLREDELETMFQPFYTAKSDGIGMGLAISRTIIEAHGGRLWAENNPHRGATLYFTMPVACDVTRDETPQSINHGDKRSQPDSNRTGEFQRVLSR